MAKTILGVVVGYIVFNCVIFALMTALWFGVGVDRVFQSATFQITPLWIALALAVSLLAGVVGGFTCSAISGSARAVQILAAVVVVLGILICLPVMMADQTPNLRRADLKMMEAMQQAQAPIWMHLASAALGGAGVLLGRRKQ